MKTKQINSINEILPMCNDSSKKFLSFYLKDVLFRGVTNVHSRNNEFFCIYSYPSGETCVCVLNNNNTNENGCCFFGDILYFANYLQKCSPVNKNINDPFYFSLYRRKQIYTWLKFKFNINKI